MNFTSSGLTSVSKDCDRLLYLLEQELDQWPGYVLEELWAGRSWGGIYNAVGTSEEILGSWCAKVGERIGIKGERQYYFEWGRTIPEAIEKITVQLNRRRTDPHYYHIEEHLVLRECADCCTDVLMDRAEFDEAVVR